ncbi:MAG: sigma 54-interacting transcriptional regulator, partial [candidate division KSB1 bacterium]|nr:sigma 54-interacting transcriptional regulator [candidate division KSB1 bacterium]
GCTPAVQVNPHSMVMTDSLGHSYLFPIDPQARLRLNHFGDVEDVSAIGFVDLLQAFKTAPDPLDFKDKLILVAVTAPGLAPLKATPLSSVLPGVLIHATVAENLIYQNYLQQVSVPIQWILILLLVVSAWLVSQANRREAMVIGSVGLLFLYWFVAMLAFSASNLILPLFYPTLAYLATLAYLFVERARQSHLQQAAIKMLLKEQVITKETQLEEAKARLAELESQLHYETTVSEQTRRLAEERKQTILKLEKELRDLQTYIVPERQSLPVAFPEIVYAKNSKMAQVLELVARVSPDDIPVLILGETGTGKEMIARAIHQTSQRREAPFVPINCGALPETLLESELFGHEKGSFTGAQSRRRGRFELANGGTIFLDEITETTPAFQARLLRVLQEGTFERLGGEQTIKVNVRVIAASNKDLQEQMEKGHFRSDLFYRLNGFLITLPPLRERLEDIPLLAVHFLRKYGHHSVGFSERVMQVLRAYPWPGNVRELENVVRRAAILAKSEGRNVIRESHLPEEILKSDFAALTYKPLEEQVLDSLRALKFSRSAISQTAQALGNRDRGTITEYFRGICFEQLVKAEYDVDAASKAIAATTEEQVIAKVRAKIKEYLSNLTSKEKEAGVEELPSPYKGLPKKYHPYLQQVLEHLRTG